MKRDLKWNPHIHALVPELIYDTNNNVIKHVSHFDFESLRKTWAYEVNRLMKERFGKRVNSLINISYKRHNEGFYVYAKRNIEDDSKYTKHINSKNVKDCVNYMMRYAGKKLWLKVELTLTIN